MYTEMIDLNIGGVEFSQCVVDFEYEPSDKGSTVQPPYAEAIHVYRVQFDLAYCEGFEYALWADLQAIHFHLVEPQVLEWVRQEQSYYG